MISPADKSNIIKSPAEIISPVDKNESKFCSMISSADINSCPADKSIHRGPAGPIDETLMQSPTGMQSNLMHQALEDLKMTANEHETHEPTPCPQNVHTSIPPEQPNTKPLFELLAKNKKNFNSKTTLHIANILELLDDYPSPEFPILLADIIKYGAKLGYNGPQQARIKRSNHPSANINAQVITDEIKKELSLGRLQKLDKLPTRYYCSPLGLVPKRVDEVQTDWRRIFNLSCPAGHSVNDAINPAFGSLRYETFNTAVSAIAKSGRGTVLMKRDIKAAFRMIPICTEDQWLLIFEWDGSYYMELFLPFGLRTAPFIFNLFGEALQ